MAKNPADTSAPTAEEVTDFDKALLDAVKGWEAEQIGFPPYWNPKVIGNKLLARPVLLDTRDENFHRYVMVATQVPIQCQRGPADGAEAVVVKPGEMFTMSPYAALPLDRYFDIEVFITVTGKRKLPGNEESMNKPRDLWEFELKVSPNDRKMLNARRSEETKRLQAARQASMLGDVGQSVGGTAPAAL